MKKVKLQDLCKTDQIGKYGIPASAEEFSRSKTRYLRISDIDDNGNLLDRDKKSVSSIDLQKYILKEGDIVFARTGNSTGRTYYHESRNGKLAFAGFLIKYGIDEIKVNPKYLKYFTISQEYKQWVKNLSNGSTRGNINAQTFADCPILLPDRPQQDLLVKILSLVDSKIELNNKINAELEKVTKLTYGHWFVQFDFPDENGKPYKSSGGEMVQNTELKREIPKGWDVGGFDDIGDVVGGSTPSRSNDDYFTQNGIAWITPKDLSLNFGKRFISKGETDVTELGLHSASLKRLPKGTVLLSSRAPIGYIAIARNEVTTNQGFKSLVPKITFSSEFIFHTVQQYVNAMIQYSSGSTFSEISTSTLKMIKIPIPNIDLVKTYTEKVEAIFAQQDILELENDQLKKFKDWLLKMIMNGKVKIY